MVYEEEFVYRLDAHPFGGEYNVMRRGNVITQFVYDKPGVQLHTLVTWKRRTLVLEYVETHIVAFIADSR
jgi:hypothetical protein